MLQPEPGDFPPCLLHLASLMFFVEDGTGLKEELTT